MSKIVYLGHYDIDGQRAAGSPAAATMLRYVLSALMQTGKPVTVLSHTYPKNGAATPRECRHEEGYDLIFPATLRKRRNLLMRGVREWHHRRMLEKELEELVQDGDTLVVYHSLLFMRAVQRLRKRRNFRLVLQACEIYSDVIGDTAGRAAEIAYIQTADAYIFASDMMEKMLNTAHKPYAVCHGTYDAAESKSSFNDGKVHCVYAGTLDPRKGALVAASAAAFLPKNYHIHILGFGTGNNAEAEVDGMRAHAAAVSAEGGATVTYDGCLRGEVYTQFVQKCDIGLSPQDPEAAFNATSFPSKILSYMSSGLRVVCIRIPAIDTSALGRYMYFYEEQTPRAIADAILQVDVTDDYDGQAVLRQLNEQFVRTLCEVLA